MGGGIFLSQVFVAVWTFSSCDERMLLSRCSARFLIDAVHSKMQGCVGQGTSDEQTALSSLKQGLRLPSATYLLS